MDLLRDVDLEVAIPGIHHVAEATQGCSPREEAVETIAACSLGLKHAMPDSFQ